MPDFFYDVWFKDDSKHVDWFIALAKGESVRKLKDFPVELTKKMAHEFLNAPAHISVNEAIRFAQVLGVTLGVVCERKPFGSQQLCKRRFLEQSHTVFCTSGYVSDRKTARTFGLYPSPIPSQSYLQHERTHYPCAFALNAHPPCLPTKNKKNHKGFSKKINYSLPVCVMF